MDSSIELAYERIKINLNDKSNEFKKLLIEGYKYFLQIRSYDKYCSPSDLIDMLWHSHILDTRNYAKYCKLQFGKFIHHNPNDSLDQQERLARVFRTIQYIKNNNKSILLLDRNIWNVCICCNCGLSKLFSELNENSTCQTCVVDIKNNLELCKDKETYQVFFKVLTGKTIAINVCDEMLVYNMIMKICEKENIPMNQTEYVYAGKILQFCKTVNESDLGEESTIHMMLKLRGC